MYSAAKLKSFIWTIENLILSIVSFLKVFVYNWNGSKHTYLDYRQNEMEDAEEGVCRNLNIKWPGFADGLVMKMKQKKILAKYSAQNHQTLLALEAFPSWPLPCIISLIIMPYILQLNFSYINVSSLCIS